MGAKSIGEIGINALIPTIANAIIDAVGVRLTKTPSTPKRVKKKIQRHHANRVLSSSSS